MTDDGHLVRRVVTFSHVLAEAGVLHAGVDRSTIVADALRASGAVSRAELYWALRAGLVTRRSDIECFDLAFRVFWDGELPSRRDARVSSPQAPGGQRAMNGAGGGDPSASAQWSAVERLRRQPLDLATDDDVDRIADFLAHTVGRPPMRRSRRRRADARGSQPDLRATLRSAMRTEGEPLQRRWRGPRMTPRSLVLLIDVSGSMTRYAPGMVVFAQALSRAGWAVDAFGFGTRLTRMTGQLTHHSPRDALRRSSQASLDWGSGTRIAENLAAFNELALRDGLAAVPSSPCVPMAGSAASSTNSTESWDGSRWSHGRCCG